MRKKILAFGIILCMLFSLTVVPVGAYTEGYYTYSVSYGEATITKADSSISGIVIIPSTLGGYPVTKIGDYAFYYRENLTSVTIPDGVTHIGKFAFYNCSSLTSITIPDSVISIGLVAFESFSSDFTSINVSENNENYSSLDGVLFNKDKTELICCPCAKSGEYTIPNGVTSIGNNAFSYCENLTSVTIPDSVTNIKDSAFLDCISLISVNIPNGVTYLSATFSNCSSLTSITIPDSVTRIDERAFTYCSSLTSITIPDSVTSIGFGAFEYCSNLTSITIPDGLTSIGSDAFRYTAWYNNQPDGLVYLGKIAYEYKGEMPSNTVIELRDGTKGIASSAFSFCSNLISITIPDSVTSITNNAFFKCSTLTSITIPNSVTSIGNDAFSYCYNLTDVYYSGSKEDWSKISIVSTNTSLTYATIHYNHIQSKSLEETLDYSGETVTLIENGVLNIGEELYFRNGYVNATNGYIKAGDKKITGNKIYFDNNGKMRLEDGYTAKVEKDNGDGTTDQGFMAGLLNPHSVITMTLEVTGAANDVDYTGKTISKDFDFTNYEVAGLVNLGFTVNNIPKPLSLSLQSVE